MMDAKKPLKVDLTKKDPRSFASYISENLRNLGRKTKEDLIEFIRNGPQHSNASDQYIEKVVDNIEEKNMNAHQVLKYISDIMLSGAGMSVIKPKSSINEEQIIKEVVAAIIAKMSK